MPNVASIDLEDWFHLLDTAGAPDISHWAQMESRVEMNTWRLLELLAKREVKATFFVLGWIAEAYPGLVREIAAAGHELASHGYGHLLVYESTPEAFRDDLRRASDAIERASGERPRGYRAPGFSITGDTPWALDILRQEGFEYDSSIFPAPRGHGGLPGAAPYPSRLTNGLIEFPVSTVRLGPTRLAFLGGGYLRLLPLRLILGWSAREARRGRPLILYLHPRDIDPGQPRLPVGRWRSFKSYVGLEGCLKKTAAVLASYRWVPFRDYPTEAISAAGG